MKLSDFSPLQIEAITLKKGNVLVSAGAGSGKTAVLIQRLYEIIKDGDARLEELLVLTFTNFAAKELKIRLRDKLSEDPKTAHLSGELRQVTLLLLMHSP
jgi:ATP-dependent helicase/nuclease subunit A